MAQAVDQLSPHFTLQEFVRSATAVERGIDNTPSEAIKHTIATDLVPLLEEVRFVIGKPLNITSGYRCLALNRAIGSKDTSQHVLGEAADFQVEGMTPDEVCKKLAASDIRFGQLIEESSGNARWTHISVETPFFHCELLTIDANGTRTGLG